MESITSSEIIQEVQLAPFTLKELEKKILDIEPYFNNVVSNLDNEKARIIAESSGKLEVCKKQYQLQTQTTSDEWINEKSRIEVESANTLEIIKEEHKRQILEISSDWNNGKYVKDIVSEFVTKWGKSKTILNVLKWVIAGVALYMSITFLDWITSFIIGGLGYLILNYMSNGLQKKIVDAGAVRYNKSENICDETARNAFKSISTDLKEALEFQSEIIKSEIDLLVQNLGREFNSLTKSEVAGRDKKLKDINDKNDLRLKELESNFKKEKDSIVAEWTQRVKDHDTKADVIIRELRTKTEKEINETNGSLESLNNALNHLAESFSNNVYNWSDEYVYKGKDSVSSVFRLGEEIITLDIEGIEYKFVIPRCVNFLNKTNISFNCNSHEEINRAIKISHNIIARALLALPASKTKITFVDPLELGGNAAPFTPLLREIYGGMVFTQSNDIDNQLSILTRAIENVIQKYLQDKFIDIADYNLKTKEVPEPYRLLVVYNFPHGFNDTMANKLLNIIKSGPKAGVHTILINDKNGKLPYGMDWNVFDIININEIKINGFSGVSLVEYTGNELIGQNQNSDPIVGNLYDATVKTIVPYGAYVELMNGKRALLHISEVSDTRPDSLDGILSCGELIKVKLIEIDKETGNLKLSRKAALEQTKNINISSNNLSTFNKDLVENKSKSSIKHIFSYDKNLPYNEIVEYINKELPNTSSIKVPFTKYIAPQNEWWQEKAHKRFAVPIGRHAMEVQDLKFDNEDDNQALLIGKPGSGKSNLLHVIIANAIWKYSPDELEIYLIDFKGGVEFTVYADKQIPHIRTIAIESEREFGLSVLDGVERELLRRENEFSKVGVQNIEQYHDNFPDVKMPRVLLIVDEFQEFYAEDDGIKQAVDDKFDRIVRKGRAFGINTLFSSQTLSGHSIKKSTKELIDIRIALMCSEMDANQILDERNPAARDLARPGEGIYNPENGRTEGNRKFQAFFIEKDDLINTIEAVVRFSKEKGYTNFKQIIFRGSEKAHLEKVDHPLMNVSPMVAPKSLKLWVGEPVAIAEDVKAVIRKQGGSNVLVAGYDENIGVQLMCSSIISIAAHHLPYSAMFYSFNYYNVDSDLVDIPDKLFSSINQDHKKVTKNEVKDTLQKIKDTINDRLAGTSNETQNIYICFFSLQRGRAFRKEGYSMSEEGNLLAYILKEGPDVGVFTLVQVDTMDNYSKNLDDNLLKEFSQRIASQMNPDNSVKLIGNQKASKLGLNRAWYYDDNENILIKFKPYELPDFEWVAQLQKKQSDLT